MEWDKGDRRKGLGARENALLNLRMAQESGNGFLLEHVLRRERNPARAFCEVAGAALALLAAGLLAGRDLERSRVRRNVFDRHWLGMLYVRYRKNRRLEHGGGMQEGSRVFRLVDRSVGRADGQADGGAQRHGGVDGELLLRKFGAWLARPQLVGLLFGQWRDSGVLGAGFGARLPGQLVRAKPMGRHVALSAGGGREVCGGAGAMV